MFNCKSVHHKIISIVTISLETKLIFVQIVCNIRKKTSITQAMSISMQFGIVYIF